MTSFKPIFILGMPLVAFISLLFLMRKKRFMFWTTFGLAMHFYLLIGYIGNVGRMSDAYERLEKFERLEQAGLLADAKNHPEKYAPINKRYTQPNKIILNNFKNDIRKFKNSFEFKQYIEMHEFFLNRVMAILFFLSAVLVASCFIRLGVYIYKRIEKKDAA